MINRVDRRSQLECLKQCGELLKRGASVLFFPEVCVGGGERSAPLLLLPLLLQPLLMLLLMPLMLMLPLMRPLMLPLSLLHCCATNPRRRRMCPPAPPACLPAGHAVQGRPHARLQKGSLLGGGQGQGAARGPLLLPPLLLLRLLLDGMRCSQGRRRCA